ncbi:hypothetical protein, partial [Mycolicibacterium sp.]|uniref:hypothetical protein n=1 Tax=Mycolicibacterium sp. TaxID=2320850 RepID=UPI0037C61A27
LALARDCQDASFQHLMRLSGGHQLPVRLAAILRRFGWLTTCPTARDEITEQCSGKTYGVEY